MFNDTKQHTIDIQFLPRSGLSLPMLTGLVRLAATVMIGCAITTQLSADGAGTTFQHARYGTNTVVLLLQTTDRHSIFRL